MTLLMGALAFLHDEGPNRDVDVLNIYRDGGSSVSPSVVVVGIAAAFLASVSALTGAVLNAGRGEMIFTWCLFFVAGTVQWFGLVPSLWKRLRRTRGATAPP